MIRYEKLRTELRTSILADANFSGAWVEVDDGTQNDAFQSAVSAAGGIAVAILPIYSAPMHAQAGRPPSVVAVVRAQFLVELAVPPTTSAETFEALCVALFGAISNFYADEEDQEDPIRISSHEMSPMSRSEGLRAQVFDCEKLCVMTPIEPQTP